MVRSNSRAAGAAGENAAADFLRTAGCIILEQNFRNGKHGEIDIIASLGNLIIFVEVKSRNSGHYGGALYSIGAGKRRSLVKTATAYLVNKRPSLPPDIVFRFDLISVNGNEILWIEDIIRNR